jgi:ribosomal protein L11 methyltransferase
MWQVSVLTTAEGEEAVAGLLERFFRLQASIYCDGATGRRTVTVYPGRLAQPTPAVRARLRGALRGLRDFGPDFGPGRLTFKPLRRENWAQSWKRHFKPIKVGGVLLIKPPWSRRKPRAGQYAVILNPGMSFGTGHHQTTLFCLQQLVRCRRAGQKQSFLDIGTGSGILAIAAAKLGYAPVEAFDNDPVAVRVSRQNVGKNRARDKVWPQQKDLARLKSKGARRHDVICANLARELLISEASTICARLKPGGKLIVAGTLRRQFDEVEKNLRQFGLTLEVRKSDISWTSGQFVRRWP